MTPISKMKPNSANHKVYQYLLSGGELTASLAIQLGLTNDLKSRISDLKNRYGVDIESEYIEGSTGAKYKKYWLAHSTPQTNRVSIRVKSPVGAWLYGEYDMQKETIYYKDGREQKVSKESFEKNLGGLIEKI